MRNEHFDTVDTWEEAAKLLDFVPTPLRIDGRPLSKLEVYVRDLKRRLPISERILEARYPGVAFAQSQKDEPEARRQALEVKYGQDPQTVVIGGNEGRMYELGPEVPPDDIDGRAESVIAWSDGRRFYMLASNDMMLSELLPVAQSLYQERRR